jgi:pentatricopeptide repeat protein
MLSNSFLDACLQCGDFREASAHFTQMKKKGFANVVSYNTILKAYVKKGQIGEAQELLREMASHGLSASKVTYHELLNAMVTNRDKKSTWRLLDEMREAGLTINSVTCSILLKSLTDRSSAAEVQKTMGLLDTLEEQVDEVLFSSVIEACIRIKQVHFLSEMIQRIRARGDFVALTAPTYGSMIKAFGQAGQISQILELWAEMESRGVQPTQITLGCMTEALVRCGEAQKAWDLIHKLQQQQHSQQDEEAATANTVMYTTVLKGFAAAKHIDNVFAVHDEMLKHGVPCNTITYNTILDACAKCCTMFRAEQVLKSMRAASVQPDIITYSTIVKGYCMEGDIDKALVVLKEMRSEKTLQPDEITYNSFLDGCAKQHRVDEALAALDEMQAAGVRPSNYTLSILVKLLGRVRRLNQAFTLLEDLSAKHKFKPNVQVYTCLMQACIQNRKLDRALALHDQMVLADCPPDEKLYTGLVRGCLQLQAPQKAVDVVRTAYQLPGGTLAVSKKCLAPAGVDMNTLVEICANLHSGSQQDQAAADALAADVEKLRGIRIALHRGANSRSSFNGAAATAARRR